MTDFKWNIAKAVAEAAGMDVKEAYEGIEYPKNPEMGDYSFPCFRLSKTLRKAPPMVAAEIQSKLGEIEGVSRVQPVSGFLNFYLSDSVVAEDTIASIVREGADFGREDIGKGGTVVLDYSAVNIAKPFHIGHLRSTMIGESLKRIFQFLGYGTFGINYLGDYGTQFGKLIVAINRWGDREKIKNDPVPELLALYVRFHAEAEKDDSLNDEARQTFVKLENKDPEVEKMWKFCVDTSMMEFSRVYEKLGVTFDSYNGERFFSDLMKPVVDDLRKMNLLEKSEGAEVVNLDDVGLIPALITKSDGSSIYLTRDLASAHYRKEQLDFVKSVYVVGSTQALHFKQLFAVLKKMGRAWAEDCVHVPFGQISAKGGSLSTRGGKVIFLEDVLEAAREEIHKIIEEKNPSLKNREEVEKVVGYGAVIFQELFTSREKDYEFDMASVTNFQGETGPYVQYTHARCSSLLRKAQEQGIEITADIDPQLLTDEASMAGLKLLRKFGEVVKLAAKSYEPHHIARYAVDIAKAFNRFYYENPILTDDRALSKARLAYVMVTRIVLASALKLVCIGAPEEM